MKPTLYIVSFNGMQQEPLTASQIAERVKLPVGVVTKRLQRGERVVETIRRPVRCYAGNDGARAPTWRERKRAEKQAIRDDQEEQARIQAANEQLIEF